MPTTIDFLLGCIERNKLLTKRIRTLVERTGSGDMDTKPDPKVWSPAQVMEHMIITNGYYFPAMRAAMSGAPKAFEETEVRDSWIGKLIRRMAGPGGNAP